MLKRRLDRLEKADEGGAELVGVVIMGDENEDERVAEEIARRGIRPERAHVVIARVRRHAESLAAWTEKWTAASTAESEMQK